MPRRQNCVRSRGTFLKPNGRSLGCAPGQKDRLGSSRVKTRLRENLIERISLRIAPREITISELGRFEQS